MTVWHRILYSCTHIVTVGVEGLMVRGKSGRYRTNTAVRSWTADRCCRRRFRRRVSRSGGSRGHERRCTPARGDCVWPRRSRHAHAADSSRAGVLRGCPRWLGRGSRWPDQGWHAAEGSSWTAGSADACEDSWPVCWPQAGSNLTHYISVTRFFTRQRGNEKPKYLLAYM